MTHVRSHIEEVRARGEALQARMVPAPVLTATTPRALFQTMRSHLAKAADDGRITDPLAHVLQQVRLTSQREEFTIYGARHERANFSRSRAEPHFTRVDGAWFDFLVTGRGTAKGDVEILAYSCEIRFPEHLASFPRFLRYDLNPPLHNNETAGLRCHVHPGHDDLQLAAPFIEPLDILDLCVYGLTWPEKVRAS